MVVGAEDLRSDLISLSDGSTQADNEPAAKKPRMKTGAEKRYDEKNAREGRRTESRR
jgi:hypothetical protein